MVCHHLCKCLLYSDAVLVLLLQQRRKLGRIGVSLRSEATNTEPSIGLLGGPDYSLDRPLGSNPRIFDGLERLKGSEDAIYAVEPAAPRLSIAVRTTDDRRRSVVN